MNTAEKFWRKIDINGPDDCWNWLEARSKRTKKSGCCVYGRLDIFGGKNVYAHRVAYYIAYPGSVTLRRGDGLFVLHHCDNSLCCNPRHLYLGTHNDNMRDMVVRKRHKYAHSTKSPRAKLSEDDVRWIRFLYQTRRANKKALALLLDVSIPTIKGALSGRHYADVI